MMSETQERFEEFRRLADEMIDRANQNSTECEMGRKTASLLAQTTLDLGIDNPAIAEVLRRLSETSSHLSRSFEEHADRWRLERQAWMKLSDGFMQILIEMPLRPDGGAA